MSRGDAHCRNETRPTAAKGSGRAAGMGCGLLFQKTVRHASHYFSLNSLPSLRPVLARNFLSRTQAHMTFVLVQACFCRLERGRCERDEIEKMKKKTNEKMRFFVRALCRTHLQHAKLRPAIASASALQVQSLNTSLFSFEPLSLFLLFFAFLPFFSNSH